MIINGTKNDYNRVRKIIEKNPKAAATLTFIYIVNKDKYTEGNINNFRYVIDEINNGGI
jgi:hypothetical protein